MTFLDSLRAFMAERQLWFEGVGWFILAIGLMQNAVCALQLPAAWRELRERTLADDTESSWQLLISNAAPPISIIVPAYNEEKTIVANAHALLSLRYPDLEILVVNDGSRDATCQVLIDTFGLSPVSRVHEEAAPHAPIRGLYASPDYGRLLVIDKDNGGGKSDAINAGINVSRNELFCVVDADSMLESEALLNAVRPFIEDPERMIAVGGTVRVVNGCTVKSGRVTKVGLPRNLLARIQYLEYIRAFLIARLAWSRWGALSIISGAFGIFRRDIALAVGGYTHGTVGEDYELIVKMHRYMRENRRPYTMRYVPEPVCWTEAPETMQTLARQRRRWQRGALEGFFWHVTLLLNPRYGRFGMLGFLNNLLIDVLGPLAEFLGYLLIPLFYFLGVLDLRFLLAYLAMIVVFGIFISVASLALEEMELRRLDRWQDIFGLALMAVAENLGYRQINSFWRIVGWFEFLKGTHGWGEMKRKGMSG